jgi:hypothetical protein
MRELSLFSVDVGDVVRATFSAPGKDTLQGKQMLMPGAGVNEVRFMGGMR